MGNPTLLLITILLYVFISTYFSYRFKKSLDSEDAQVIYDDKFFYISLFMTIALVVASKKIQSSSSWLSVIPIALFGLYIIGGLISVRKKAASSGDTVMKFYTSYLALQLFRCFGLIFIVSYAVLYTL